MEWVLVIVLMAGNGSGGMSVPFENLEACKRSATTLLLRSRNHIHAAPAYCINTKTGETKRISRRK